jgi:hypothetical protein
VNDHKIDGLLRGAVPAEATKARERARTRLRAAIGREMAPPLRRRRRLAPLVAAALLVVGGLLALQIALPPGPGGPRLSAAEEIGKLGRLSLDQRALKLGPDDYLYTHVLEFRSQSYGDQSSEYVLAVKAEVESWYASDGSGARETTYRDVVFASPLDRENWVKAGSPPVPEVGVSDSERFSSGELAIFAVEDLPTDPDDLRTALENDVVIETGGGDVSMLSSIGSLLSQENLSGDLRRALFEVAATIPSVTVQYEVADEAGRAAVAVTASDVSGDTRLFFAESDARLLGSSVDYPPEDGHAPFTEWRVYLDSGLVSDIGQRPPN